MNDAVSPDLDGPTLDDTRRALLNYFALQNCAATASADRPPAKILATEAVGVASKSFDWSTLVESGVSAWWHDHPARSAALLGKAAAEEYARRKPMQTVVAAAAAGAALVLLKPWRLVSTSALALTLLRSSNFNSMAATLLETAAHSLQKEKF
jgi:hypothetical protein